MKKLLRQLVSRLLIARIAEKDSAGERPRLTGGAKILFLKRAEVGRHGLFIRRRVAYQDVRFEVAQVKRVAVFLESTTFPAGDANRSGRGDRPVNLAIHVQDLSLDAIFDHGEPSPPSI